MAPASPALCLEDVSFAFAGRPILSGVNLQVEAGQFVALVGPSGSGKSTLFRIIAGLLSPDRGRLLFHGAAPIADRGGRVGYMPQRDCLMPWRRVLANATALAEVRGVPRAQARRQALELLPQFGLGGTEQMYPDQLSGGMRQRLAFLRTVLTGSDILLLDEPFGALDALTRADMQEWLLGLWERLRLSVLFITHDVEEALLLADGVQMLVPVAGAADGPGAERPPAGMTTAPLLPVDLPRPRHFGLVGHPDFVRLRADLRQRIHAAGNGNSDGNGGKRRAAHA